MNNNGPVGWDTRNEIMMIRQLSKDFKEWTFTWVLRSTNAGADAVAKWARNFECNFEVFENIFVLLPPSILKCFSDERVAAFSCM